MPLLPKGLSDRLFNRIRERVRHELGTDPISPVGPVSPVAPTPGVYENIRERVKQYLGLQPSPEQAPHPSQVYVGPPRSLGEVRERIQAAGRQQPPVLLRIRYNGTSRNVEPYSYRYRAREQPHIPLFFGFCDVHQQIHSFKLQKIEDIQVTQTPYQPRWVVEF